MIDVVYFTTQQSFYEHQELRYSLRSLQKHVSGVDQVWVVGVRPEWLTLGAVYLEESDPFEHNKDANIIRKMLIICRNFQIKTPFLFVNDDHYFSQDCAAGDFPYYHKGELRAAVSRQEYPRRLANTRRLLEMRGQPTLNYDLHTPILIQPERFLAAFQGWDYVDFTGPGVVMKSVYANSCPAISGVYLPDCKLTPKTGGNVAFWAKKLTEERPCWSSGNHLTRLVQGLWEELYPEPSKFENNQQSI